MAKYECHVTVEPYCAGFTWGTFCDLSVAAEWKPSVFEIDEVDDIAGKWFMSYASDSRELIIQRMKTAVAELEKRGLTVLRWKLEETMFDSKHGDKLEEVR